MGEFLRDIDDKPKNEEESRPKEPSKIILKNDSKLRKNMNISKNMARSQRKTEKDFEKTVQNIMSSTPKVPYTVTTPKDDEDD